MELFGQLKKPTKSGHSEKRQQNLFFVASCQNSTNIYALSSITSSGSTKLSPSSAPFVAILSPAEKLDQELAEDVIRHRLT